LLFPVARGEATVMPASECPTVPEPRSSAICQLSATAVRRHAADRKKTGIL
jgi:hypothetical protein